MSFAVIYWSVGGKVKMSEGRIKDLLIFHQNTFLDGYLFDLYLKAILE